MEQAVIVRLGLQGDFGTPDEREAIGVLEEGLEHAIDAAAAGEFDGDEFGGGEAVLFMYGPDADRLFLAIEPVLKTAPVAAGGYAVKRYGEAGDPNAREVRVIW